LNPPFKNSGYGMGHTTMEGAIQLMRSDPTFPNVFKTLYLSLIYIFLLLSSLCSLRVGDGFLLNITICLIEKFLLLKKKKKKMFLNLPILQNQMLWRYIFSIWNHFSIAFFRKKRDSSSLTFEVFFSDRKPMRCFIENIFNNFN